MGNRRVSVEQLRHLLRIRHFIVMLLVDLILDPRVLRDVCHALSVRPVGADQQLVPGANDTCKYRLHSGRSAALHEYCRVLILKDMGQL